MTAARAGAAAPDIRAHYDAGDAFFALFLDSTLSYSCALFDDPAADLDAAQRAKMDWHLDRAGVTRGTRLLDIGCGWGGLMERAVWDRGAAHATGLTLSDAQAAHVAAAAPPRVTVHRQHWADHAPSAPYDAIVSIGAFEHFAEPGLSRAARVAAYADFFSRVASWMVPGGRLALQTIAYPAAFDRAAYDASAYGAFVRSRIFPQSDLPTLDEILAAAGPTLEPEQIRNDRRHYAVTTRHWLSRLRSRHAEAAALVGERRVADMARYFRISIGAFEIGNLQLLRLGLRKPAGRAAP
ncbi:MAG: class I SAM-dependent methyltransferase [Hyphomonadaceae bacterium]|nr:class I SAM-dependent methyltransferase [Hyphomonadaceae bacterium]